MTNNLMDVIQQIEPGAVVKYLGGDPTDDMNALTVGDEYTVIATGVAESKETGEEFPLIAIALPSLFGKWAVLAVPEDDMCNAQCFELVTNG